jgi:hypothetical protein
MAKIYVRLKTLIWSILWKFKKFDSVDSLVKAHFTRWSDPAHQNREGLSMALNSLPVGKITIVETGTSAYGTDSSRLFDSFVRSFGGSFFSVDINSYPSRRLRIAKSRFSKFFVMDSVAFLQKLTVLTGASQVNLFYLDSWDVDWGDPIPSAMHGQKEIESIKPFLRTGTILVIDDTPNSINWIPVANREAAEKFTDNFGVLPGKGALYAGVLSDLKYEVLHHDYNLVLKFK